MEKIYNVPPTKIDIEGFGSVMIRSNYVDQEAVNRLLFQALGDNFSNHQGTTETSPIPLSTSNVSCMPKQLAEVVRCACGKPGNYWGVGLAFPDPLCNSCVRKRLGVSGNGSLSRVVWWAVRLILSAIGFIVGYGVLSLVLSGQ